MHFHLVMSWKEKMLMLYTRKTHPLLTRLVLYVLEITECEMGSINCKSRDSQTCSAPLSIVPLGRDN